MNLFDITGEKLFRPLTGQYKSIYFDCLTIIYNSFRFELSYGIDRENLMAKLIDYFDRADETEIAFDDEEEVLRDSRTKATTFLRKLRDSGWIEYEIEQNQKPKIVMPDYAVTIIQSLQKIANPREMEYQSEISLIYSTLTNKELLNRPYPLVLCPVFDRTRALFDGLKKLNTSIKKYIEDITADKTAEEILQNFLAYRDEIGSKAYHRIKVEDNVSRFRNSIIGSLRDMMTDPIVFERTVKGYQAIEGVEDYLTAQEDVKERITSIIDVFRTYDEIVEEIDKKHFKYMKSAIDRAKFLLLNTNNAEGKISTILQYLSETYNVDEQGSMMEDAPDDVCGLFNLYPAGFVSEESLKMAVVPRKQAETAEIYEPLEMSTEAKEARRTAMSERNNSRFSRRNINAYANNLFLGSSSKIVSASEIPIESKRDVIRLALLRLYGNSPDTHYRAIPKDEMISTGIFSFRNFDIESQDVSTTKKTDDDSFDFLSNPDKIKQLTIDSKLKSEHTTNHKED